MLMAKNIILVFQFHASILLKSYNFIELFDLILYSWLLPNLVITQNLTIHTLYAFKYSKEFF